MRKSKTKRKKSRHLYTRKNTMIEINREIYSWAKPYDDPNIINVSTGLGRGFEYSPIFIKCIADTMVELTGYRRKDYIIAEDQTQTKHVPGISVWHHAWEEKDGKYRMQLVDFQEHKKTCPHAGGCKLWLLNTKKRKKYAAYKNRRIQDDYGNYSDVTLVYPIKSSERAFYQNGYVSKKTKTDIGRKKARLWGVDIYGNLLYKNAKNMYFWNHESDELLLIKKV